MALVVPASTAASRSASDLVQLDLGSGGGVDVALLAAAVARQAPREHRQAALHAYAGAFLDHLLLEDVRLPA
jgi:hypothetical protein